MADLSADVHIKDMGLRLQQVVGNMQQSANEALYSKTMYGLFIVMVSILRLYSDASKKFVTKFQSVNNIPTTSNTYATPQ